MTNITIVYPTDPLGIVPGGTDTCIRDIIKCAPADITIQLIGVTTDTLTRPVGKWTVCNIDGVRFNFFALLGVKDLKTQSRIPLSARFTIKLFFKSFLFKNTDVIQFNRIEPAIALAFLKKPKILIIHQNMNVLKNKNSDIRWKHFPGLYFSIENFIINRIQEVFIVRKDAVIDYQKRFPTKKDHIQFLPTWMNSNLFSYLKPADKLKERKKLFNALPINVDDKLLVFVGRFDYQKDPTYLINSVVKVFKTTANIHLILIGDGVLRSELVEKTKLSGFDSRFHFLGALPQETVAKIVRASDLLLLSSAYEGMPRCVVESLGCGVPVVTTDVGEVGLLIKNGENGYIIGERNVETFADTIILTLSQLDSFKGQPCLDAVNDYTADVVLSRVYDIYRKYASRV